MRIKHRNLRRKIISILKANDDRVVSAAQMIGLLKQEGLGQQFMPKNTNALAQILIRTKGISNRTEIQRGVGGGSYLGEGYYLESEEAFNEWFFA